MVPNANEHEPDQPDNLPLADYREVLAALPNAELLSAVDLTLLELEKRLYRYAHLPPEDTACNRLGWYPLVARGPAHPGLCGLELHSSRKDAGSRTATPPLASGG